MTAPRALIPIGVFGLIVASAFNDQYFRDEFYYLACSYRLDWGYVDHPPLSVALLWAVRHIAGESLLTLRLAAALVFAFTVWLSGSIARRFGASAFAEAIAMIATAIAPMLLAIGSFYSMNVIDVLIWTMAARVLIDVLDRPTNAKWAFLGLVLGLGLQLLTSGPWVAGLIAGTVFAPHVIWQIAHGWPTLEFIQNASRDKMQTNTPLQFLASQVMNMNPFTLPVWLGGLLYLLVAPRAKPYRPLGVAVLAVAVILILNRTSRSSYLAAAYPLLFAAGGVALERMFARRAWRVMIVAVLLVGGAVTAPLAVPLLPTERYVQYSRALGFAPGTEEKKEVGRLPQFFADRQGWDQFVDQVAAAFDRLSPEERMRAAVLVANYGEAGAIASAAREDSSPSAGTTTIGCGEPRDAPATF
jgi:hypothetical protein